MELLEIYFAAQYLWMFYRHGFFMLLSVESVSVDKPHHHKFRMKQTCQDTVRFLDRNMLYFFCICHELIVLVVVVFIFFFIRFSLMLRGLSTSHMHHQDVVFRVKP